MEFLEFYCPIAVNRFKFPTDTILLLTAIVIPVIF